jgi:lipopolysaccharide transport system ATP-binding protein
MTGSPDWMAHLGTGRRDLTAHPNRWRDLTPILTEVRLLSDQGEPVISLPMVSPLTVEVSYSCGAAAVRPVVGVVLSNLRGAPVFGVNNRIVRGEGPTDLPPAGVMTWRFDRLPLVPGVYLVDLYFGDRDDETRDLDVVQAAIAFEVTPADVYGTGKLPPAEAGSIFWPATWTVAETRGERPAAGGEGVFSSLAPGPQRNGSDP